MAVGLFTRDGTFHPLPELPLQPLEELLSAHIMRLLVTLKLLPPERVQVLHSWKHPGFNVHAGDSVPTEHKVELESSVQFKSLWLTAEAGRMQRYSASAISVSFPSLRCHRYQREVVEKTCATWASGTAHRRWPPPARLRTLPMGCGPASRATTWIRCPTTKTS